MEQNIQTWTGHTPYLIFAAASIAAFAIQYAWLRRVKFVKLPWLAWILAAMILRVAWQASEEAGNREATHIQRLTQDFARLYASEIEQRGHWKLPSDAARDNPLYLDLIHTEMAWEKLNPDIADIYTLRKTADGKNIFIVDSETDYNRNGAFDEEREQRTPIGEVYDKPDEGLERAFRGEPNFYLVPVTDRWGTWVSAYVPLYDPARHLEGVLGVDFDAHEFAATITQASIRILALMALLQLVLLGSSTLNAVLRAQIHRRKQYIAKREDLITSLRTALAEVKTLSGLIPICTSCKKVRDDHGYWSTVEQYVRTQTDARFANGMCPVCQKKFETRLAEEHAIKN